jgi:hypothetical protein
MTGPGVAPAARTMLKILSDVAREYAASPEDVIARSTQAGVEAAA